MAAAAATALIPQIRRPVSAFIGQTWTPSPAARRRTAVVIALVSCGYFILTAILQDRDLFPKTHDDCSYVIGLRQLARFRLWYPPHPNPDFFDTFYVINQPVYASLYFPGTALLYVPADWLRLPTWLLPALASGAVVGLLYRVISELLNPPTGLLAALLTVSLSWFRMLSVLVYSQVPLLLMTLLLLWAWLRWRRNPHPGWALAMGAFAGWAAIIRPLDALCYALAVGLAMLAHVRRDGLPSRHGLLHPALVVAGAIPFLSLQLLFNQGVTGRPTQTPYTFYLQRDQPGTSFGFHAHDPAQGPQSTLPQKRDYYQSFMVPRIRDHQPGTVLRTWSHRSLPMLFDATLPARVLVVFVPVSVLGLTTAPRRVLWSTLPLFVLGYALNTFFLEHYAAVVIPAVVLSVLLGLRALAEAWPRFRDHILAGGTLLLVSASILSLYELNPVATLLDRDAETRRRHEIDDETFRSPTLRFVRQMEQRVQKPAVILFRYTPGDNVIEEPVYNTTVPFPDDAPVIRAHDLGDTRNLELFDYYARKQPDRMFYRFDRATNTLTPLGRATELAKTAVKRPVE